MEWHYEDKPKMNATGMYSDEVLVQLNNGKLVVGALHEDNQWYMHGARGKLFSLFSIANGYKVRRWSYFDPEFLNEIGARK